MTIEIAGSTYRLVSDAGAEHLQRLAGLVNNRIDALGPKASRSTSPAQKLALVALSLIDDLESTRAVCQQLKSEARDVVLEAIGRIDRHLEVEADESTEEPSTT